MTVPAIPFLLPVVEYNLLAQTRVIEIRNAQSGETVTQMPSAAAVRDMEVGRGAPPSQALPREGAGTMVAASEGGGQVAAPEADDASRAAPRVTLTA